MTFPKPPGTFPLSTPEAVPMSMPAGFPSIPLQHRITDQKERLPYKPIGFKVGQRVHVGQSPYVFYVVVASDGDWTTLKIPGHSESDAIFEVRTKYLQVAE